MQMLKGFNNIELDNEYMNNKVICIYSNL